jgi:hypothetical protein
VSARRRTPDVKRLAASNPPPRLGGLAGLFAVPEPTDTDDRFASGGRGRVSGGGAVAAALQALACPADTPIFRACDTPVTRCRAGCQGSNGGTLIRPGPKARPHAPCHLRSHRPQPQRRCPASPLRASLPHRRGPGGPRGPRQGPDRVGSPASSAPTGSCFKFRPLTSFVRPSITPSPLADGPRHHRCQGVG